MAANTSASPLKLGIVDYLNMQPLTYGLEQAWPGEIEVYCGAPSQLAQWLAAGSIDAGMVPTAAWLAHPEWQLMMPAGGTGSMIGARGAVASVLTIGGGAPEGWQQLRPDSHSLTSNALARVILQRRYGVDPQAGEPLPMVGWQPATPGPSSTEALVMIGSRALRWRNWGGDGATVLDLGAQWWMLTGLPFVFAVWAARPDVDMGEWPERLEAHKIANRQRLAEIAQAWPGLDQDGLTAQEAQVYFKENLDYDLDADALRGMERFREECRLLKLIDTGTAK